MNSDGTLDSGFNPDADFNVSNTAVQPDGKILIGGQFTRVNGTAHNSIARLENDAATQTFTALAASRLVWLRGGASPEAQHVAFELSIDRGSNWTALAIGTRIAGGWELIGVSLPTNCLVRGRARVTGGLLNGSCGIVESLAAFPSNSPPTIANPIKDFTVNEDDANTVIDLSMVFQDAETRSVDLIYSLQGNSNPALVAATIDNKSDALILHYQTNEFGSSTITVRATDSVGLFAEETFAVRVNRIQDGDPGDVDTRFIMNVGGNFASIYTAAVAPLGNLIAGGEFTTMAGTARTNVAQLNADDTLDMDFNPTVSGPIYCTALQSDGKIVIGGAFTNVGGITRNYIARLNSNGSLDLAFNVNANNRVYCAAFQADEKIIIGGPFTAVGGTARSGIARLSADGTVDSSFNPNVNTIVLSATVQRDGKIIIGGSLTRVGGIARTNIARLNPDGTLDTSFDPYANNSVNSTAVQEDGKIVISGFFSIVTGTARNRIARLNADGTLDMDFDPDVSGGSNPFVLSTALQTDGKIVIGGGFTTVGGTARTNLTRLNADGTLDAAFNLDLNGSVYSTTLQPDGKIIIGGGFGRVGGEGHNRLARLHNDAATQSLTVPSTNRVEWLRGGASPETQFVTFELSTNGGTTWTPLGMGTRITGGWEKSGLSLPAGGLVRGRARVISGQYNGSSGLVETLAAFPSVSVRSSQLTGIAWLGNGAFQFGFTNLSGIPFTALATTNLILPSSNWTVLGPVTEIFPGQFQFTDLATTNFAYRFYQIRSP